jgi:PKD repeat protein
MVSGIGNLRVPTPLTKNYGDQLRGDVICDGNDNVYIVSNTRSTDFPAINTFHGGTHDGVVVRLAPDLSQVTWSRFVGGSGADVAYSIRFDADNNLYVAGGTDSPTMLGMTGLHPINQGGVDGWIMSFTDQGVPVNGTYLGTPSYDQAYFIDLNGNGDVYAYGQTTGDYAAGQTGNLFVHKLSNNLAATEWVRLIGPGVVSPTAFLVSDCGYIYVSGWGGFINNLESYYVGGSTAGLPVTPDAFKEQTTDNDFYLLVLSADGFQNLYGTFFGGSTSLTHVDGGTSRFDKHGIVYHAVCASCGGEDDFPAHNVPEAFAHNGSTNCNNAVFKFDLSLLKARIQTNSVKLDDPGFNTVCIPQPIAFQNLTSGGEIYYWDLGDGTKVVKSTRDSVVHYYKAPGSYRVWLKAVDEKTCMVKDSTSTMVHVYTGSFSVSDDKTICANVPEQLQASGADEFLWTSDDGSFTSNLASPWVTLKKNTTFYVTMITADGCKQKDTVALTVITPPNPDFKLEVRGSCFGLPIVKASNLTDSLHAEDNMFFDFGDGTTSDLEELIHRYESGGDYTVKLVTARDFCVVEKTWPVRIHALKIPNVITPDATESKNDTFTIQAGTDPQRTPADLGLKTGLVIYNRWGKEVFKTEDYKFDWKAGNVDGGIYYYEVSVQTYATCKGWLHVIK